MSEIIWKSEVDTPIVLNDGKEKDFKICLDVQASHDIMANQNVGNNCGVEFYLLIDKNIEKMDEVVDSITSLLIRLKNNDTMTIVTYTDSPQIIAKKITRENIHSVKDIIERGLVSNYKSSNLYLGLKQTRSILQEEQNDKVKKVLLISNTQEELSRNIIEEVLNLESLDVTVDCLSIGEEANYSLLEKISSKLGGITNLIGTYTDIDMPMRESLNRCHNSILTNVKLKLRFNPTARVRHVYRSNPTNSYLGRGERNANDELVINLGNMEPRKYYSYYFDNVMRLREDVSMKLKQNNVDGGMPIAIGTLEYNIPSQNNVRKSVDVKLVIVFTNNPNKVKTNDKVVRGYYEVEITKLDKELAEYVNSGEKTKAINTAQRILTNCKVIGNTELLKQYMQLISDYNKTGKLDQKMLSGARSSSSKPINAGRTDAPEIKYDVLKEVQMLTR